MNITNPSTCTITYGVLNPSTLKFTYAPATRAIDIDATVMKSLIGGYFYTTYGADISVERVMYDNATNGNITTNLTLAKRFVFTIYVLKSIPIGSTRFISSTIQSGCSTTALNTYSY